MIESGIYIRVGSKNLLLEEMEEGQRQVWLSTLTTEGLIRTVNCYCELVNNLNRLLEGSNENNKERS